MGTVALSAALSLALMCGSAAAGTVAFQEGFVDRNTSIPEAVSYVSPNSSLGPEVNDVRLDALTQDSVAIVERAGPLGGPPVVPTTEQSQLVDTLANCTFEGGQSALCTATAPEHLDAVFAGLGAGEDRGSAFNIDGDVPAFTLHGGAGNDSLEGIGDVRLAGNDGSDYLTGGRFDEELYGDDESLIGLARGADTLLGREGNDTLIGGAGQDFMNGGAGDDLLRATDDEPDVVHCGPGADIVEADALDSVAADCESVQIP